MTNKPNHAECIKGKRPDYNSQTKTAAMLGVTRQAVQKNQAIKEALDEKKKVNYWHPTVQAWKSEIDQRNETPQAQPQEPKIKKSESPERHVGFSQEVSFSDIENMTIKEVVERYGGVPQLKHYVASLKEISDWKAKELKYQKQRKDLVDKNLLASALFSLFDSAFRRIVSEYPGTVTDQIIALANSGEKTARIDIIELQESTLSQILKSVKSEVIKGLGSKN